MAKILVVDDNSANRMFLVSLLGYGGHELLEAPDGAEALALISAECPDLVITDILMPTMDGYELVRRLRLLPGVGGTPVIFCTAHFHERDARDLASKCGVSLVLTKPCEAKTVIQAVSECLGSGSAEPPAPLAQDFDRGHLRLLTDKLSEQTGELAATNLRLEALLDVSLQLASETDPGRLLNRFCGAARDLVAARYSSVAVPAEDGTGYSHVYTAGIGPEPANIFLPPPADFLPGVLESRRPTRIVDAAADPAAFGLPASIRPFESVLVAPLVSPTRAYGWLCLFHRLGSAGFGAEDERLAGILAALVGRVYENGSLYARERLYAAELKREMADRRKAQEESAQLADIVQSSEDAIIGMTLDGDIMSWNRGARRVFGYSAEYVEGKSASILFGPQHAGELRRALDAVTLQRSVDRYETFAVRQGGDVIEVAVTMSQIVRADGGISGVSAIIRDVTAHKKLQRQLLVAQKMEAIGRLSAGVAHDFNNLLTVIGGYSALLLSRRNAPDPDCADILEIQKAADRATVLTRQLLAFSRRQIVQPRVLDLNAIVSDMDRMLRRVIGEDIELAAVLDASLGSVEADSGQIEQVIMNLAVNARDAMPEGGRLTLETANLNLHGELALRGTALPPGAYVVLAVTDTGIGMDAETTERIFEPFFTTKGVGRGTGLGLSTVYGIVEQAGGAVAVYSEPGHGTTFRIFLPRVPDAAADASPPELSAAPGVPDLPAGRGSETLLVVEDEDGVRALVCAVLRRERYTVLEARNGGEALLICEQHEKNIDLMISDITMPGMSGVELAGRVRGIRPSMKVLFTSGYAEKAVLHQRILTAGVPFLEKPFAPPDLARKVREVLDDAGRASA